MIDWHILYCYVKKNSIENKLESVNAIVFKFNDLNRLFKDYIFVTNIDEQTIKKINNFESCYFLKKVGSNKLATISTKTLKRIGLVVKKKKDLKNKLVKILKGSFKDQCGRCISSNSKTATIKTFLFNSREIQLIVPISYLATIG